MRIRYSKLFVGICLPALCTGLASLLLFTSAVAQTIRPSTQKELKVFDPTTNGTGNIGLRAAAGTSSYTLTLPASAPSVNQVLSASAVTGGNVSLTWATPVSGTVTSVGSNSGTGLTGGPITGAGTLAIDTVLISTRLWRQKGLDSVAALPRVTSVATNTATGINGGTIVSTGTLAIDTALIATRAWRKKGDDSVAALLSGYVPTSRTITINGTSQDLSVNRTYSVGTVTQVSSGTGLSGGTITGSGTLAVDTLLISTRAWRQKGIDSVAALANTKVSSVSGTAPISSSGGTSPTISISQASGSANGFLTSSDWTTFNNKQNAITLTTTGTSGAATLVGATLNIPQYQAALTNPVTGTGALNYLSKFATAGTLTNSLLFDNGTNVGIGTTSPANLLDVAGTFRATGATIVGGMLTLSSTASAAAGDDVLMINSSNQVTKTTRAALLAASGWALTGNSGTTNGGTLGSAPTGNFVGTTGTAASARDLSFVTNNVIQAQISTAGVLSTQNDAVVNGVTVGRGAGGISTNTAVGSSALAGNTTGYNNAAMGMNALYSNTTGNQNAAMGMNALLSNTTGNQNAAMGVAALQSNTTGVSNAAMGMNALLSNTTGVSNAAMGMNALFSNTTGNYNSAMGVAALFSNTTGNNNLASGVEAGRYTNAGAVLTSVDNSVFLGFDTRALAVGNTNTIVIGQGARGLGSNTAVLGNSSITATRLQGRVGVGADPTTATGDAQVQITPAAAANIGLVVTGAASQTGNLLELRNSSGTAQLSVGPSGATTIGGALTLSSTASAAAGDDVLMINSSNQVTKTTRAALVGSSGWTLTGNAGTSASTNFIGTTDAVDFVARTNNTERMRITSDGNVQIRNNNVAGVNSVARPGILEFMGSGWHTTNGAMPVGIRLTPVVEYWNNNPNSPYGQTWPDLAFSFLNSSGSPSYLERMRITGAGNVGIGTTSPTVRLHVSGSSILANNTTINPDSYANQIIAGAIADGSGWGAPGIGGNQGSGASWAIGHNGANLYFGMQNGSANATMQTYMQFAPDRNLYLVPTSGNVYVGSRGNNSSTAGLALWTSPIGTAFGTDNAGLDIRTPATNGVTRNVLIGQVYGGNALTDWANAQLAFSLSNAFTSKAWAIAALGVQDALTFRFQNGVPPSNTLLSDELMRITSAGNVGLGTTTIGSRLQVNGNAAIGYSASTAAPTNGLAVAGVIRQGNASILTSTRNDNVAANGTLDLTISNSVGFVGHLYVQNTSLANANNRTYTVFFVAGRYSSNSTITELNSANGASTRSFSVANVSTSTSNILRITNTSSEATSISAVFVGSDGF